MLSLRLLRLIPVAHRTSAVAVASQVRYQTTDKGPMRHYDSSTAVKATKMPGDGKTLDMNYKGQVVAPQMPDNTVEFLQNQEDELRMSEDLIYAGYVPPGVYAIKKEVFTDTSAENEELENDVAFLLKVATEMKEVLEANSEKKGEGQPSLTPAPIGNHPADLTMTDINHVRYITVIAARRLGDHSIANRLIDDILESDPANIDAIESRLEISLSGSEEMARLRPLLNMLRGTPHIDPETQLVVENDVYEDAFSLLADILLTAMMAKARSDGEGACMVFFGKVLQTLARELFPSTRQHQPCPPDMPVPNEFGMLIERITDCLGEQLFAISAAPKSDLRFCRPVLKAIVPMLKTLVSMEAHRYVPFSEATGLVLLLRLQTALRLHGSKERECHAIGERMKRHYHAHRQVIEQQSITVEEAEGNAREAGAKRFAEGSFAVQYQNALFQHVHDEVLENPEGKRDKIIALIEEYPHSNIPWKILAFSLYLQKKQADAVIACRKAVELEPSDATSILLLGNLYMELGHHVLAKEIIANFKIMTEMDQLASSSPSEQQATGEDAESNEMTPERLRAAKAEIGVHALTLEQDEELHKAPDPTMAEVEKVHNDYIQQMRRAHMYSAKGLPPLLYVDREIDVAFKEALDNPEFGTEEYLASQKDRAQKAFVQERRQGLQFVTGSGMYVAGGRSSSAGFGSRRTIRNMERDF